MCDANYSAGLRCYEDSEFGLYSTGIADTCNHTYKPTSISENKIDQEFELIPNPAINWIELHSEFNTNVDTRIYNIYGQPLQNAYIQTNSRIDIANLKCGVYFIQIKDSSGRFNVIKLVKN